MTKSEELSEKIISDFSLVGGDAQLVEITVEEHHKKIEEEIVSLIKDWEAKMGEDDKTLYSLGLRRALDVVRGEERTLNS